MPPRHHPHHPHRFGTPSLSERVQRHMEEAERAEIESEEEQDTPEGWLGSPKARRGHVVRALEAATNGVRLNGLNAVAGNGVTTQNVQWQWNGWIVGVTAMTRGQTTADGVYAGQANLALRVTIDGSNEELFINGAQTQDYALFAHLSGYEGNRVHLFRRRIRINRNWSFYVANLSGDEVTTYQPDVLLHVIKDTLST
jgi:hypothetical protein